jgi:cob(I)alamin adenosyltransferase
MKAERGYVVVITGEGKGKTTSALGMALRAVGHNFRVIMLQFIKGSTRYGELEAAKRLAPELEIVQLGRGFVHVDPASPDPKDVATARAAWDLAKERILSGDYFMVVLDEINNAIEYGLLPVGEVLEVLEKKPQGVTLVLTGRGADPRIIAAADLVSEVKEVKHPYREGQKARKGIEY